MLLSQSRSQNIEMTSSPRSGEVAEGRRGHESRARCAAHDPSARCAGTFPARDPRRGGKFAYSAAILGGVASSASDRRGGDIGRSTMRTPVARAMALPTAAVGGTIGTSPTPRTP